MQNKKDEMKAYMKKLIGIKEKKDMDRIKEKMIDIRDEIEYLENENVDEDKFWGMLALNNDEVFDYGRDILKEDVYDNQIILPYKLFDLFTKRDWFKDELQKPVLQLQGILRSGNPSGALLKGKIDVKLFVEEVEGETNDEEETDLFSEKTMPVEKQREELPDNKSDRILAICKIISDKYPFDILKKKMLQYLFFWMAWHNLPPAITQSMRLL